MAVTHALVLFWFIVLAVPVLLVMVGMTVRRMVPLFRSYQEKLDSINRIMREQLTGIRVVRAFVREEAETERFDAANWDISRVGEKVGQLFVFLFPARKGKNPLRPLFHYSLFQFEADFNQACPWSLNSASTVSPSDEDVPSLPAEAEASEALGLPWPAA